MPDPLRLFDHTFTVGPGDHEERLDVFLVRRLPGHSRTFLQRHIRDGRVEVAREGRARVRSGLRVEQGDVVRLRLPEEARSFAAPEPIPLDVLFEDEHLLLIDKPAGLTVHPGAGASSGTLANALAYHFGRLSQVQGPLRPGIVHRLDKDTSGVMIVAKDDATHHGLAAQFRERTVQKEYEAVAKGVMDLDADLISAPLGPHRHNPTRMAVRMDVGRAAETYFEVVERLRGATHVRCKPRSGRTHQIRVHLQSIGHPIVSDSFYGGVVSTLLPVCPLLALHARRLTLRHPRTGEELSVESPLRPEIRALVEHLREARPLGLGSASR